MCAAAFGQCIDIIILIIGWTRATKSVVPHRNGQLLERVRTGAAT